MVVLFFSARPYTSGMSLVMLLQPSGAPAVETEAAVDEIDALARRLGRGPKAAHYRRELVEYPPSSPEGSWLALVDDPDEGTVAIEHGRSRFEARRRAMDALDDYDS